MYLLLSSDNFSLAAESTYIGGNFVQVVKPTIVAVGWYPVYVLHGVEFPWSKYQQPFFSAASKRRRSGFQKEVIGSFCK